MSDSAVQGSVLLSADSAGTTTTKQRRQQILDAVREVKAGCSRKTRKELTEDEFVELMRMMDARNREWKKSGGVTGASGAPGAVGSLGSLGGSATRLGGSSAPRLLWLTPRANSQGHSRRTARRSSSTLPTCFGTNHSRCWETACLPRRSHWIGSCRL